MNAKIICILIVAMFLVGNGYAGNWNKNDCRVNAFDKRTSFIGSMIQKIFYRFFLLLLNAKPSVDSEVKIYGGRQYAQAFYPYFENLTKIELPIRVVKTFGFGEESQTKNIKRISTSKSSSRAGVVKTTSYSERKATPSNSPWELGDLIVRICENESGKPGKVIAEKRFSYEEVLKANGLITWELEKQITLVRGVDDPYWQEHGLEPRNEEYGSKLYFIVVTANGGFDNVLASLYYTWDIGESEDDEAKTGVAYRKFSENTGWVDLDFTLSFNIDGCLAWEKPADGIEEHYGVFCSPYAYRDKIEKFASLFRGENTVWWDTDLEHKGYHAEEIYTLLCSIDIKSDGDDIIVFFIDGDGAGSYPWSPRISGVTGEELANIFNRMQVKGICMIFSSCYSGSFCEYSPLKKENRVIMASCRSYEVTYSPHGFPWSNHFVYYLYEAMKKGCTTAEEIFEYAKPRVEEWSEENPSPWGTMHPTIYDSYPGNLPI